MARRPVLQFPKLALPALVCTLLLGGSDTPPAPPLPDSAQAAQDGKLLYDIYCSSCHGIGGRGDGKTAGTLSPPPPDLTRLGRDNDGEFPVARVILSIDGRREVPGHANGQMPIWGLTLQDPAADSNQDEQVRDKILKLTAYLKSIQLPAEP